MDFFDADGLTGEDRAEVDFLAAQTDSAATSDHDDLVVEWIVDVRQPLVGTCRSLIDLRRALHVQGFVRTLVVEDLDEIVEASLLLQLALHVQDEVFHLEGKLIRTAVGSSAPVRQPFPSNATAGLLSIEATSS